jgi:hypothetical protein
MALRFGRTPEPLMSMMSGKCFYVVLNHDIGELFARLVTAVMLSSDASGAILAQVAGRAAIGKSAAVR